MEHFIRKVISNNRNCPPEWSTHEIRSKVQQILSIDGKEGVLTKMALLGGLNTKQLLTLHSKQYCFDSFVFCECDKVHVMCGSSELMFVSTMCSDTACFTVLPKHLWEQFRALKVLDEGSIAKTNSALGDIDLNLDRLAMLFAAVHSSSALDFLPSADTKHSAIDAVREAISMLLYRYSRGWEAYGVLMSFEDNEDIYDDFEL